MILWSLLGSISKVRKPETSCWSLRRNMLFKQHLWWDDVSEHSPSYWPKNHTRILYDGCLFPSFSYRIKMKRSQRLPLQVSSKNIKSKCLEIGKSTGCCLDLFLKIMPDVHWTNQKYRVAKKNPTIWWRSFFFLSFLDTLPISPQFHHDLTRGPITIHQP